MVLVRVEGWLATGCRELLAAREPGSAADRKSALASRDDAPGYSVAE